MGQKNLKNGTTVNAAGLRSVSPALGYGLHKRYSIHDAQALCFKISKFRQLDVSPPLWVYRERDT